MPKDFEKRIEEKINKLAETTASGFKAVDKKINDLAASVDERFDDLAAMTARGFEETATKTELHAVEARLDIRLDRIENILLRDHNNRIERLEDKLLQVEVILGQRLKPS